MDLAGLQIGEQLGRGAMGVVHRAFDPASQRQVALKILLAGSADRFEREGVLSARLDHPSIVRVHTSGVREGRPCLVYELIEGGRTLTDALGEGCSLKRAVELLRDTARGLGHAHARGVIHRDVKPDNVLIDGEGRAKVTDFGLAASKGLDQLTVTGAVLGTPLYMAPETLGGAKELVGPATDVWALGAILYEALAGLPPYSGDSLVSLSVQVIDAPVPPIQASRAAPPALLAVAKRALEKDPQDRHPNGDAFADDLDAYLRGELVAPRGSGTRLLVALAGVVLVVAAFVLGGAYLPGSSQGALSPTPRASASLTPTPSETSGLEDAEALVKIGDLLERYLALRRWWKQAPPRHPQRRLVSRALRRCLSKPLRVGALGEGKERVTASFAPGGRILASGQRSGSVLSWEGTRIEWSHTGSNRAGTCRLPKGEVLWWTVQPLQLRAYGPLGGAAPALSLGRFEARYLAASPDSKRLAIFGGDPDQVLILAWPEGSILRKIKLPAVPHAMLFDRAGDLWVGVGLSQPNSFTTLRGEVLKIDVKTGRIRGRTGSKTLAGSAPLSLALDPLSGETLLGLSSGDLVRLDAEAQKLGSLPAFVAGDVLNRTFPLGIKAMVFNSSGDRLWIALNNLEKVNGLVEIDWKRKKQIRRIDFGEESESLMLSADETLLLRGTRGARWELWAAGLKGQGD